VYEKEHTWIPNVALISLWLAWIESEEAAKGVEGFGE
jgi:hypothetical protein